jgi:hypothetical protein
MRGGDLSALLQGSDAVQWIIGIDLPELRLPRARGGFYLITTSSPVWRFKIHYNE